MLAKHDWPWWRGPARNGIADASQSQKMPLRWSETENVLWKTKVPGRGHASPTVVGDRVFLATADETAEVQSVICYDRRDGRQIWKVDVHTGGMERKGHQKSSQASATVASDGERIFANFLHEGAIYTTALGLDGRRLWQTKISDFVTHQGFGSSPAVYQSLVLVSTDNKAGGVVAALDRRDGKIIWQQSRPKQPNYTSPAVLNVAGRDQVLVAGCDHISSFDPLTGHRLWEIDGSTTECVGSIVTDGSLVFASGGYPDKLTLAVRGDGSGEIAWRNNVQTYVPSMLVYDGHLYTVTDGGVALCWEAATGKEVWKSRLGGNVQRLAGPGRRPHSGG
jgi:outer membrane protein assembly factor BamB